jgi:hypothetical protein
VFCDLGGERKGGWVGNERKGSVNFPR